MGIGKKKWSKLINIIFFNKQIFDDINISREMKNKMLKSIINLFPNVQDLTFDIFKSSGNTVILVFQKINLAINFFFSKYIKIS